MRYVVLPVYDTEREHGEPVYTVFRLKGEELLERIGAQWHNEYAAHRAAERLAEE